MEHYRSTIAVTGIAVLGLVAAAGILHPANFERAARPAAKPAMSVSAPTEATAWVDPPAASHVARRRSRPLPDVAALMKAEPTTVLPSDGVMVQPLPAELTLVAATSRKGEGTHGRKLVRRATAARQVALNRQSTDVSGSDPQQSEQAPTSGKIDPIGDLIRGLGLGNNS